MNHLVMLLCLSLISVRALAACPDVANSAGYLKPSATGTGTGADWTNAAAFSSVTFSRGCTYYLASGAYAGRTLSQVESASSVITIQKATDSAHGTSTGWTNGSTSFGVGQATFSTGIVFTSSFWVFDGATGGGPGAWNSGYGIKITETRDANPVVSIGPVGGGADGTDNNITVRHVEMQGKGSVSTSGGSASNDGIEIWGNNNNTVSYVWMHGIGRCPYILFTGNNNTFEYSYIQSFFGSSGVHSELMSTGQSGGQGDVTFRYNLVTDIESTGGLMWDNHGNTSSHMWVYGNVFYQPSGVTWGIANGVIGGWSGGGGEQNFNQIVYNNTFIGIHQNILSTFPNTFGGNIAQDNLFYNCDSGQDPSHYSHDYNFWINSGGPYAEANGTTTPTTNPFVDYINLNFGLVAANASGLSLSSPFNIDPLGLTRGADGVWDRGAYEYQSVVSTFSISGALNAGGSGASVAYSGTASGNVTADGSGNYSISGLSNGTYTVTPTKSGYTFSPTSRNATVSSANVTGINFTATALTSPIPSCTPAGGNFKSGRMISCTNAAPGATTCWRRNFAPTTNGNGTCTAGNVYTTPFTMNATGTVQVIGTQAGNADSSLIVYNFNIDSAWTSGWIMNLPESGRTIMGGAATTPSLMVYGGSTSLLPATWPTTPPSVGHITGAGTIFTDPVYGTKGVRLTDANFDPSMAGNANNSYSGSQSGSADDLEFNTGDFLTIVANQGGAHYLVGFDKNTLALSRPYSAATAGCPISNCSTRGGWASFDGLDFSLADPCKIWDTNNTTITSYTFGSDVVPFSNPCSSGISGPPSPVSVVNLIENLPVGCSGTACNGLPSDFGVPLWDNSGGESLGDTLLVRAFASANYYYRPPWKLNNAYALNSQIKPVNNNPNGYTFIVTVAGTSGGSEPNWNSSCPALNNTCTDGGVTWKNQTVVVGQGTGFYVVIWSPTKGVMSYNTATGAIQADVGWAGGVGLTCNANSCTGTSTANAGAQFSIHNVKMNKSGNAISISPTFNISGTGACSWQWIWVPGTTTVYCSQTTLASGHWVLGQKGMINDPGGPLYQFYYRLEPSTGPSGTPVAINNLPSPACTVNSDQHASWQSADANDTWPFMAVRSNATISNNGLLPFDVPVCAWVNELVMNDMDGGGKSHRIAFTFGTGFSTFFNSQWGIAELSPSGRFASVGSDWLNTLRNAAGTAACNGFAALSSSCIANGPAWKTGKAYALNYVINPTSNNAGNFSYQATVAGTSGATQPTWSTNCVTVGSTCSDNGITWKNIGAPTGVNAAGTDAFLWDLLSAAP